MILLLFIADKQTIDAVDLQITDIFEKNDLNV